MDQRPNMPPVLLCVSMWDQCDPAAFDCRPLLALARQYGTGLCSTSSRLCSRVDEVSACVTGACGFVTDKCAQSVQWLLREHLRVVLPQLHGTPHDDAKHKKTCVVQ